MCAVVFDRRDTVPALSFSTAVNILELRQLPQGAFDAVQSRHGVTLALHHAVEPEEPAALDRLGRLVGGCEDIDDHAVVIGLLPDRGPGVLPLADTRPEGGILASGSRQHGDESALPLVDVGHVLARRELAVGAYRKSRRPVSWQRRSHVSRCV